MAGGNSNALRERIEAVQKQAMELRNTTDQALGETRDQVEARIDQFKAEIAAHQEAASQKSGQAAERAQSQWQSMRADAAAKMQELHDRIEHKHDEVDAKRAAHHAEVAEYDAFDALDFAWWAVEQAELAVLDAVDARAWADERAAAAGTA